MHYRVERIRMKLQGFDFQVNYAPGLRNPSDYMPRNPITKTDKIVSRDLEKHVNLVVEGLSDAVTLDEIKTFTINDEVMKLLYESIKRGTLVKYPQLTCFSRVFNQLSIVNGIIIKGEKILVPSNLRQRVLSAGHDGHQR